MGLLPPDEVHYQLAHVHDDRSPELYASQIICYVLACIAVALRLISRRLVMAKLQNDDYMILVALVSLTRALDSDGYLITAMIAIDTGAGRHAILLKEPVLYFKLVFSISIIYLVAIAAVKFSILFLYRRIFGIDRVFNILTWLLAFVIFGVCIGSVYRARIVHRISARDATWSDIEPAIWAAVEIKIGIVSACLPTLRPVLNWIIHGSPLSANERRASDETPSKEKPKRRLKHSWLDSLGFTRLTRLDSMDQRALSRVEEEKSGKRGSSDAITVVASVENIQEKQSIQSTSHPKPTMPYTILLFLYRKPGLSFADFKSHYENSHMPLLQSIGGPHFPKTHTRHYLPRPDGGRVDIMKGAPEDLDYDAMAELVFEGEKEWKAFLGLLTQKENKERVERDEEEFQDRARLRAVMVGESFVTREGEEVLN
ncbi:MAG: hypothetical protein LQ351_006810 [Letrouitia transgressa]|nr:MAG: hypothetical protein LQ351_006810 [Letrouitia transgressa]